jgi:hypothetical protein
MGYGSNEFNVQSSTTFLHLDVAVQVTFVKQILKPGFSLDRLKG